MVYLKLFIFIFLFFIPGLASGQKNSKDTLGLEEIGVFLATGNYEIGTKKTNLPPFVRRKLTEVDHRKFKIANAGQSFNSGDALLKGSLPDKRIVYILHSSNIYILTYEQGGFGRKYNTRIVQYRKKRITCLTTLVSPPHSNIDEFKSILERKELFEYVPEKSFCNTVIQ